MKQHCRNARRLVQAPLGACLLGACLLGPGAAGAAPAQITPVAMQAPAAHGPGSPAPAAGSPFTEDPARVAVERFLQQQAAGLPGKVSVQVAPPSGGRAPECIAPDPFLPAGASPWGRVSVGVRCGGERPWVRYMQARVSVLTDYYVAARALGPGEPVGQADVEIRQGDLGALPRAVITDPAQLAGAVTANRIAAGSPLRTDLLRKAIAVRQGQTVTVAVEGDAFQITSEGKVLADAATGNTVQVRLRNGQVVNGLVRSGDTVVLQ
ncbi:FlgA: Flagella basal body P-ring formation protein; signal peptide [Cupriavidus taiwanensis]|uniref:flagellar basal body P-ring formation chaperone FlgA n=1 Tax=Cupriavidus taiwanensis TaxID=164546 RepID=UPI000E1A7455|nr:flagellar basal body P-ring formation chaperone FlgA [Cupriavidus taiwanensis]SOY94530.1 FlgA: Flagella basal body P-ring formation protein; signal peptide [Cupriavidus taiwanensis]SOY98578.1 FlgA: Flagella basal body P-ring formation protein; signal peptide [Cupriavidus taiwanensis]